MYPCSIIESTVHIIIVTKYAAFSDISKAFEFKASMDDDMLRSRIEL